MISLLGTTVRGVRSRALLSVGSVVLAALALGSAVLGPIFSEAVTNSYVVTRLQEAPAASTGLARVFTPDGPTEPGVAVERAIAASDALNQGPWGSASATLQSEQYSALRGAVTFWSRDDVCAGLVIEGRCPSAPGEVLMLAGDVVKTGAKLGKPLEMNIFEPTEIADRYPRSPLAQVVVVGSYATPIEDDVWQYPLQLRATNEQSTINGGYQPYQPAPLLTTTETMQALGPEAWIVKVDTPLQVPADATPADLTEAVGTAKSLERTDDVEGGTLVGDDPVTNDLEDVEKEVRAQQSTARKSIAPAVLSLVLVALALLMRLLTAAGEIRVPELALASLRGVSSTRLWLLGLAEPLVVLATAIPLGIGFGVGLAAVLTKQWLVPGLPLPMPWQSWVAAALVLLAAIGVACVAVGMVVRDTLASQLSGVRRPQQSRRWAVIAQLTLVALALAVLMSKLSASGQSDPDLTDMVLPVLLAVVAGLAATRLTAAAATWWTRRRGLTKSLSGFVAARAISRRQEGTLVILPITAAVAVAVFGVGVYDSAATWRTSVAATVSPAATTWTSSLSMRETRDLTHRVDPEGEYLMAAASVLNPGASFAVVDAERLPAVATWPETWSPGRTVEQVAADISLPGAVPQLVGRRLSITVDNQAQTSEPLSIEVRFGSLGGIPERGYLGPFPAGESTQSVRLPASCRTGCPLEGMTLGGGAGTTMEMAGSARVLSIAVDGEVVEAAIDGAAWVPSANSGARSSISTIDSSGDTIDLTLDSSAGVAMARLTAGGIPLERPAVRGVDVPDRALEALEASDTSGAVAVDSVSIAEGMPFVGPAGLLVDYSSFVSDRPVYDNLFNTRVLMREGAPESMSTALTEAGLTVETTLAAERRVLDQSAYALALRLYAVVAALVLLMALAGLFVSTAVQLPARRRDAAALRVVGVARGSVMSAVAREFLVVLGGAAVAGILAGSLAQYVVLRTITIGTVDASSTPDLVATISPLRLIALALISVVVLGIAAYISAALTVRGARGSTLRETAR